MKRVNIIGTSGSGKSTLGKLLAKKLSYPFIEIDSIFWLPGWKQADDQYFFSELKSRLSGDCWVVDGNYSKANDIKWNRADTIIWVDYSFPRTLLQAITRAFKRSLSGDELWEGTGNRESFRSMFSKDSIILWTLKTYRKNRANFSKLLTNPQYSHINFIRIGSPKEMKRFLNNLPN
jgi:adenylate kinase family enzyme